MIYDMPIRNLQKLVDEIVVLISAFLKNFVSHFRYQPKFGKAFYNDVAILCQTRSYVEVLVNQKQNFTDIAIIFWQYFYSSVISSHHK